MDRVQLPSWQQAGSGGFLDISPGERTNLLGSVLPELRSIVREYNPGLAITKPFSPEELLWLLATHGKFMIAKIYRKSSCTVTEWKLDEPPKDSVTSSSSTLVDIGDYTINYARNYDEFQVTRPVNDITNSLVGMLSPVVVTGYYGKSWVYLLDLRSTFLLLRRRFESVAFFQTPVDLAREMTLRFLDTVREFFKNDVVVLEMYLSANVADLTNAIVVHNDEYISPDILNAYRDFAPITPHNSKRLSRRWNKQHTIPLLSSSNIRSDV